MKGIGTQIKMIAYDKIRFFKRSDFVINNHFYPRSHHNIDNTK
jgi:hypothetical protein